MSQNYENEALGLARDELQGELFVKNAFVVAMVGVVAFVAACIITMM